MSRAKHQLLQRIHDTLILHAQIISGATSKISQCQEELVVSRLERLAIFVEHFPPYLGSDRSVYELGLRAAKHGVSVHFVATQPLRYLLGERPANWPYVENWKTPPVITERNVTYEYLLLNRHILSMWARFPPVAFLLTILIFSFYGIRSMLAFNPDVVVSAHATPIVGIVSLLSSKMVFKPLVVGCPDWMSAYAAGLINKKVSSLGPALLQIVELMLYKLSNRIFAVTEFLKNLLVDYGIDSDKIHVISNGVDSAVFRPNIDTSAVIEKYRLSDRVVVLFTGHLESWAGVSVIRRLAEELDKDFPQAVVLLVGAGETSENLFQDLIENNLGHIVVHAGLHPYEDMPSFTAAADIALCLFPNTPVAQAASPLKLFEYMASGVAIVATNVAGTAEVMNQSVGVLVSPDDTEGICNSVIALCKDPEYRTRLGAAARIEAERRFSWDCLSEVFVRLCSTAVS